MRRGDDSLAADGFNADFDLAQAAGEPAFTVDLDGFEGPLDLLLELARRQRVDLARISILALAEQYLEFVEAARKLRLHPPPPPLVLGRGAGGGGGEFARRASFCSTVPAWAASSSPEEILGRSRRRAECHTRPAS